MIKKILCIVSILTICASTVGIICLTNIKVSVDQSAIVKVNFNYEDIQIEKMLSDNDSRTIIELLNDKQLHSKKYMGELSCGFTKDIAFIVGNEYFDIACDGCGYIFYESNEKYIELDENEIQLLHSIIEKYGGFFPCV